METHDPLVDPLSRQLERQAALEVQLVQPPSQKSPPLIQRIRDALQAWWRDRLLFVLSIFLLSPFLIGIPIWGKDIYSLVVDEIKSGHNGLDFAVRYSSWLVPRDEESFILTLVNNSNRSLRVTACLAFKGRVPVETGLEDSNFVNFGILAPDQRKTRTIKLLLGEPTAEIAQAELWVSAQEWGQMEKFDSYEFDIASIPCLKSSLRRLAGTVATCALPIVVMLLRGALTGTVPEE